MLLHIGSLLFAAGLLLVALYGVDLDRLWTALRQADYRWLAPLALLIVASNVMRAWRWNVLIDALPSSPEAPPEKNTLRASFASIMIGYMMNYVAPRMGEVARTVNMSTRTGRRFSALFGTVVSERIFDTIVLGLALLSAVGLLFSKIDTLYTHFLAPITTRLSVLSDARLLWIAGLVLLAVLLLGGGTWYALRREGSTLRRWWTTHFRPALASFRSGLRTLLTSPRRGTILGTTLAMWGGYLLMAYLPFRMLHLAAPYDIGLVDAWTLMALGALGLLVPTPGGLGSYHYITIQALTLLYGVPAAEAATYAVLTHAAQFIFYVAFGAGALIVQGPHWRRLFQRTTATSDSSPAARP